MNMNTPEWVRSQIKARGLCEQCGEQPQATEWAGNGQLICWSCCDKRIAAA
jgi:formylmethanofuran dehydrogenase subunit E